jgi:hypothetical protein
VSVWSPGGTFCVTARTSGWTCRSSQTFAWVVLAAWSSEWTCFNAFNAVVIDQRQTTVTYVSPSNLTVVNNQFKADGTLNAARAKPNNAGFGAATRALAMRNVRLQLRFQF